MLGSGGVVAGDRPTKDFVELVLDHDFHRATRLHACCLSNLSAPSVAYLSLQQWNYIEKESTASYGSSAPYDSTTVIHPCSQQHRMDNEHGMKLTRSEMSWFAADSTSLSHSTNIPQRHDLSAKLGNG
jgi:hypothetical protein